MAEPSSITTNSAGIYSADLLYEQNCKCGTIEVLGSKDVYQTTDLGDKVWRIDVLSTADANSRPTTIFSGLSANNISAEDCLKLTQTKFMQGQTIMGDFTGISIQVAPLAVVIIYKDCTQS